MLSSFPRTLRLVTALSLATCASVALATETDAQGIDLIGINLSGANFAPHITPGKVGTNYFYPEKKHFSYYAEKNIRLIRFPFIWERLQHDLDGLLSRIRDMDEGFGMQPLPFTE